MRFRPALTTDIAAVAALHADSWRRFYRSTYADTYLDGDLRADRLTVWTARLEHPDPRTVTIIAEPDDPTAAAATASRSRTTSDAAAAARDPGVASAPVTASRPRTTSDAASPSRDPGVASAPVAAPWPRVTSDAAAAARDPGVATAHGRASWPGAASDAAAARDPGVTTAAVNASWPGAASDAAAARDPGVAGQSGIRQEPAPAAIAGFVHVLLDHDQRWGSLVDNLHVVTTRQRNGVGSELLTRAARAAADRARTSALYLWVQEQNTAAQAFYAAHGGEVVERAPVPDPGGVPGRLNGHPMKLRITWPNAGAAARRS